LCHFELGHEKMLDSLLGKTYYIITKMEHNEEGLASYTILKAIIKGKPINEKQINRNRNNLIDNHLNKILLSYIEK